MGNSGGYRTDIPQAREVVDWQKHFNFSRIESIEQLKSLRDSFMAAGAPPISFDTETSSLEIKTLELAGFSFCWDKKNAYYVPVGHKVGDQNLPLEEALEIILSMLRASELVLVYNLPYDMRVLRKYGVDVNHFRILDVMCLVWNADTNLKKINLKLSTFYFVGFKMTSYVSLIAKLQRDAAAEKAALNGVEEDVEEGEEEEPDDEEDGSVIFFPPNRDVVDYASADALCTLYLYLRFLKFFKECNFIVTMDSYFELTKMYLEETEVLFDQEKANTLITMERKKQKEIEEEVYKFAGKKFNILSGKQLIQVFTDLKVPLSVRTKPTKKNPMGNLSVNEAVLDQLASKYSIARSIVEYRSSRKAVNTYLLKLAEKPTGCFQYLTHRNPTGRLQGSGRDRSGLFVQKINIQNITKPSPAFFKPIESDGIEGSVLGWNFELVPEEIPGVTIEGFKPGNIREIMLPRKNHVLFSADYSGQELVIIANMSKDPAFLEPFKRGEDPHKATAIKMVGQENYNKDVRKVAKTANFNCTYLGNEFSLKENMDKMGTPFPIERAKIFFDLWKKAHWAYFSWLETQYMKARRFGYIESALGRRRRVAFWFNSPDYKEVYFGKKTVSNSPIQGLGGDIIRFVLIRIFNEVLCNPKYEGKVYFVSTVHDEVNFSIDRTPEIFYEISHKILDIMVDLPFYEPPFNWEVKLSASPSVGLTWGGLFPFKIKEYGNWIPDIK
jgi:DNA polymerase-1